jgi:hypothetical protein
MDDWEVYDSVPAHTLEDNDRIVIQGKPVQLTWVQDKGSHIYVEWEEGLDIGNDNLDPHAYFDLWTEV